MDIISELNSRSKKSPRQFRWIALYYLIVFWLSLIVSVISIIAYIILVPDDKFSIMSVVKIVIGVSFAILINFLVLKVVLGLIKGSNKSYWLLIAICILQFIGFQIGTDGYKFMLGGFPITFNVSLGSNTIFINVITVLFAVFLLSIKKDYSQYILLSEEEKSRLKDL